jgi:Fe2+ or Zn2+ uptake regulation protein
MADIKRTTAVKLTEWKELYADNAEFVEYAENELAKLANKNVKAKERAAAKKEAGDELRAVIEEILKNATEPMTREMVLGCIDNADELDLTCAKIGARITQLVQLDLVHKTDYLNGNSRCHSDQRNSAEGVYHYHIGSCVSDGADAD